MLTLAIAFMLVPLDDTPAWPGFLGANASKVDASSIPTEWSPTENIAWQRSVVGHGQSSPVIYGDHVFVTSCDGPKKETLYVYCVKLSDGSTVWEKSQQSSHPEGNSVYISRSAPTPVVDANHVFAYFESGDVYAYTHAGELAWKMSLTEKFGQPMNVFGLSASPVQTEDHVIILIDDDKSRQGAGPPGAADRTGDAKSYIVALKKTDGTVAWKTDRENRTSWSSPAIVPVDGEDVVVCSSAGSVDGYSPTDGKLLFSFTELGGNSATTPMPVGNGEFLVAASPGRGEGGERADLAKKSNGLMKITKDGDSYSAKFVWANPKLSPSFGSPIVHNGYAYWLNRVGSVMCVDVTDGKLAYQDRIETAWATPIGLGDRVYFFAQKKGLTSVLASGPEFKVLAKNKLWNEEPADDSLKSAAAETGQRAAAASRFGGQTTYGAAAVSGSLIIRTGNMLYCIRG
ncbi:MAG: PQQ-binding-like beta-propeller repeat protein [Planctomycetaceae bacterium]